MPTVPELNSVEKEERILIGSWGYPNNELPLIDLRRELLTLCGQIIARDCHP